MENRDLKIGVKRGIMRTCPNCGEGRLFDGYLTVKLACDRCGNANGAYRADDAAPYFTILLVGHLMVAPLLTLGIIGTWPLVWLFAAIFPPILAMTLGMLPFVKGAVIGALWSLRHEAAATAKCQQEVS